MPLYIMSSEKNPTRTRVLKATWSLLDSGGGSRVRMSDIAKVAGISRQALYLHFPNRAELLIATTRHIDEVKKIDDRLAASRAAQTGRARLSAFVEAWGNYIPEIYGVATALIALGPGDEEARTAWQDRLGAVRHGCASAVAMLARDGDLVAHLDEDRATDLLATLLSVPIWEGLCQAHGWSQSDYIAEIDRLSRAALIRPNPTS